MIHHMFVFGVVIPTVVTIALFLGFLLCWFKFNMREKIFGKNTNKKQKTAKHKFTRKVMQNTSDSEFCQKDINSPSGESPHQNDGGSAAIETFDGSVRAGSTKQYVNLQTTQNGNIAAQTLNQMLSSGITDSDGDTDYPRLYDGDYLSQNCCSVKQNGLINTSSCMSPSSELDNQTDTVNSLVQHTYHFPDVSGRGSHSGTARDKWLNDNDHSMDSEDDSENSNIDNGNYGHFVLVSQITVADNKKDHANSLSERNIVAVI